MTDKEMTETCYLQWLLGKIIEFKNSGEMYSVCVVTNTTLMISKGNEVLRTLRNTTNMISGESFVDSVDYDNLWTFKGTTLGVIRTLV